MRPQDRLARAVRHGVKTAAAEQRGRVALMLCAT